MRIGQSSKGTDTVDHKQTRNEKKKHKKEREGTYTVQKRNGKKKKQDEMNVCASFEHQIAVSIRETQETTNHFNLS